MSILDTIAALSKEFGTVEYVRGGGGNTSAKDSETVWVKPSGTTLGEISPDRFVALDRSRLAELYEVAPPQTPTEREALVKEKMMAAVREDSTGRPSVEAPLHNAFEATYVVHTHPALVNGMTCARDGGEACARLFPDSLWVAYTDPGYTLSMVVRKAIQDRKNETGKEPRLVFLQNHGVFVAGDTPEEIRTTYTLVMNTLRNAYSEAGILTDVPTGALCSEAKIKDCIASILDILKNLGEEGVEHAVANPPFATSKGPISPDHIVYSKSFFHEGEATLESVRDFIHQQGYWPRVIACDQYTIGIGNTEKNAKLSLELAWDGALVLQLAEAFGGIQYMTDRARDFIDNWEVEAYRRKIAE